MTTPNNTINDSDVLYGSVPLTIDGVAYETDDIKIDPVIVEFIRTSSKNIGNGRVAILTSKGGSATLMYATSTTAPPVFGGAFTVTLNTIAYVCSVGKVGIARTKGGESKIPIEFYVNFGTVVLSVAT